MIEVAPGETFVLQSPSPDGIGGYLWAAEFDPHVFEKISQNDIGPHPVGIGGGRPVAMTFRVKDDAPYEEHRIVMHLARPWLVNDQDARQEKFDVRVLKTIPH